jgi:tRNA pseudouridine13 synthase
MSFSLDFPLAYGPVTAAGDFRLTSEDFQVDEVLGYEPCGEGEHVYLQLRKRGENTAWVAQIIARLAGVKDMDVSYCGRKDRHAVTTQWFSVYLPRTPEGLDWSALNSPSVSLLQVARHGHKLRRGEHQQNNFVIRLRAMQVEDRAVFAEKLDHVLAHGVPNYFGEQRFGRNGNNLSFADALLVERKPIRDKQKRGLIISAARSYLFNLVLAARVTEHNWQQPLEGEPATWASGPLWGRGRSAAQSETLRIEQDALAVWQPWCHALEHQGLQQERRALGLQPRAASWSWLSEDDLELRFSLEAGEFATAVLRELAILRYAEPVSAAE